MGQTTRNSRVIKATAETLYRAFADPAALEVWLVPGDMTGKVHDFEFKVGGGYEMSLYYPAGERERRGKTTEKEDRYTAHFVELIPNKKIVQTVDFDSSDPDFSEEMIVEITLEPGNNGTKVIFLFRNIPPGIKPEDNEAGTISTLEKLAAYVGG